MRIIAIFLFFAQTVFAVPKLSLPSRCGALFSNSSLLATEGRSDDAEVGDADFYLTSKFIAFDQRFEYTPFVIMPHSNLLAAQFRNKTQNVLVTMNLVDGSVQDEIKLGRSPFYQFQTSSDGSQLALLSKERATIYEVNSSSLHLKKKVSIDLPSGKNFFRVSPNMKWLVANDYLNREISVHPLVSSRFQFPSILGRLAKYMGGSEPTPAGASIPDVAIEYKTIAFSPDGESMVLPSKDHSSLFHVRLSDPSVPNVLPIFSTVSNFKVEALAVSSKGLVAMLSKSNSGAFVVTLIDLDGHWVGTFAMASERGVFGGFDDHGAWRLRFSPNGEMLALMTNRGLYFYSLKENRFLKTSRGYKLELSHQSSDSSVTTIYPPLEVSFLNDNETAFVEIAGGIFEVRLRYLSMSRR